MPYNLVDALAALEVAHGNLDQTISILGDLDTGVVIPVSDLRASLDSMSVDLPGTTKTVLYSGSINPTLKSEVYAINLASSNTSVAILNNTDAFKLLENEHFDNALIASSGSDYNALILGSTDPVTGKRIPDSLWDDISRSFAENASGEIITVTPKADPYRVFAQTELLAILDNENVTMINGIPKDHYIQYMDDLVNNGMSAEDARVQLAEVVVKSQSIEYHSMKNPTFAQDLGSLDETTVSNMAKAHDFLKKLGIAGDILALSFAVTEAQAAYDNGDTPKATKIMADWMAEIIGGATAGYYTASVTATALAPLAAMGPMGTGAAAILTFASGMFGAIAGGEAAQALLDSIIDIGREFGILASSVGSTLLDEAETIWDGAVFGYSAGVDAVRSLADYLQGANTRFGAALTRKDPLAVDLNDDGVITTLAADSVYFDIDNDGVKEAVSWIGAGEGWIARDVNANGVIDSASELFGDATVDGFTALAGLDSNSDGKIDFNDTAYDELLVWRDLNSDGVSQSNELLSLASDLFIREINLGHSNNVGTAEAAIGTLRVENMILDVNETNTTATVNPANGFNFAIFALPELRGYTREVCQHFACATTTRHRLFSSRARMCAW